MTKEQLVDFLKQEHEKNIEESYERIVNWLQRYIDSARPGKNSENIWCLYEALKLKALAQDKWQFSANYERIMTAIRDLLEI